MEAWREVQGDGPGLSIQQAITEGWEGEAFRAALMAVCKSDKPDAMKLGYYLRSKKGEAVDGWKFQMHEGHARTRHWQVVPFIPKGLGRRLPG
jgi:hypothetical protein